MEAGRLGRGGQRSKGDPHITAKHQHRDGAKLSMIIHGSARIASAREKVGGLEIFPLPVNSIRISLWKTGHGRLISSGLFPTLGNFMMLAIYRLA